MRRRNMCGGEFPTWSTENTDFGEYSQDPRSLDGTCLLKLPLLPSNETRVLDVDLGGLLLHHCQLSTAAVRIQQPAPPSRGG